MKFIFCRTGTHTSGKQYLRQALSLGAAAVICEKYDEDSRRILSSQKDICVIETDVSAQTQARLASNFYDFSKGKASVDRRDWYQGKNNGLRDASEAFFG